MRQRRRHRLVAAGLGAAVSLAVASILLRQGTAPAPADRPAPPITLAPGEALRLAVFGTSLTAGSRWPEAVASRLAACLGRPVPLTRVAKPGATSLWALGQVGRVATARPDVVLVEFAINDADILDGLSLAEALASHRALLAALAEAAPQTGIVLLTMSPAEGLRGLARPRLAAHYDGVRALAAETGAGLVDLYPRWLALPRPARGLGDGLHPVEAAALPLIVPVLVPYLARAAGIGAGADCPPG